MCQIHNKFYLCCQQSTYFWHIQTLTVPDYKRCTYHLSQLSILTYSTSIPFSAITHPIVTPKFLHQIQSFQSQIWSLLGIEEHNEIRMIICRQNDKKYAPPSLGYFIKMIYKKNLYPLTYVVWGTFFLPVLTLFCLVFPNPHPVRQHLKNLDYNKKIAAEYFVQNSIAHMHSLGVGNWCKVGNLFGMFVCRLLSI